MIGFKSDRQCLEEYVGEVTMVKVESKHKLTRFSCVPLELG